jgi:hypothetical protein
MVMAAPALVAPALVLASAALVLASAALVVLKDSDLNALDDLNSVALTRRNRKIGHLSKRVLG